MIYLGDYPTSATIQFKWQTNAAAGESITRATDGTLKIYKGSSTTERSSLAGVTRTEDFDSATGIHHVTIDLADNTDAGFYAAGSEYQVVMTGMTIDSKTINAVIAHFSIERAGGILALLKDATYGLSALETLVDDLESRIGTPSNLGGGATIAANLADIEAQTDDIGTAGAGLTAIPWNASWDAEVQSEVADALDAAIPGSPTSNSINERVKTLDDAYTATRAGYLDNINNSALATTVAQTGDSYARIGAAGASLSAVPWNANWDAEVQSEVQDALEVNNLDHLVKAAVDTDFATTVHANSVVGHLADNGAGFDRTTDSLEAIRDAGSSGLDAAGVRAAIGLASANLDTQLSTIDDFLDSEVAAIKAKTDNLPSDPADESSIQATLSTMAAYIDTEVAAIKAKTDLLTFASGLIAADVQAIGGTTASADKLERSTLGIVLGTVGSGSTTTSIVTSSLSPAAVANDQYNGRILTFDANTSTAALRGQATDITDMTSGGVLTVTALTTSPVSGDSFVIT
jgi:hypothetical protein